MNAGVEAPVTEKVWTTLGPEFGKDARKTAMIVRALYGLKSAAAAFRSHLVLCIDSLGYGSYKADPDSWLKTEVRPDDWVQYFPYLLCYVDDIMFVPHNADAMLEPLHQSFSLNLGYGEPDICLGLKLFKTRLHNGVWAWTMSPVKYIQGSQ